MKRSRGPKPSDPRLVPYPGLTCSRGLYYARNPITGRKASLGTRDFETAVAGYLLAKSKWKDQVEDLLADRIVERIVAASSEATPIHRRKSNETTLAAYARYIRIEWLDYRFDDRDKLITPIEPKLLSNSKIEKRRGKPISVRSAKDYGQMIKYKIEPSAELKFPMGTAREQSVMFIRRFLSAWLTSPAYYNHLRDCLSKIYQQAIREGLCVTNPCKDIEALPTFNRRVYMSDQAYAAITGAMMVDQVYHQKRREFVEVSSEWEARAIDMLYLISGRPGDVLRLTEKNFDLEAMTVKYRASKTGVEVELDINDAIADTVRWFRAWRREQGIASDLVICYPRYKPKASIGKAVPVNYLSKRFARAVVKAGFAAGEYQMRDLRRKGLTDEDLNQGENKKGGHTDERSRRVYVVHDLPMRAKSTLSRIGGGVNGN